MNFGNTRFQVDPASGLSLPGGIKFGEQKDGSIIRPSGELITPDDRLEIMAQYEGLPVSTEKEALKSFLDNNTICIVRADTGSGKSTQIPKILAEVYPGMQIVVTQPRIVAAMQLADRVGKEMISNSGNASDDISGFYNPAGKIGYRTGSGNSSKNISNISYHTDGLELKRQIHGHCPDILVIDEAHGYSVSVEMLMKLYRDLHMKNKNIRLVIMSATIDATNIKKFFDLDIPEKTISGRQYPIVHEHKPGKDPVEIVLSLVGKKSGQSSVNQKNGYVGEDILVFLPGKKEINEMITRITSQTTQIEVLPLHAQVSPAEKAYALRKNPDEKQRVIIATNVAQESLTPDGIKTVISTGEVKVMYNNQGIQELHTKDISFFDYMQQAGRGGRQSRGKAESTNMKSPEEFIKEAVPPISRQALHGEILDLEVIRKKLKLPQNGKTLTSSQKNEIDQTWSLAQAVNNREKFPFVHRIDKVSLSFAYKELQEMGALDKNREITQLGEALTKLPLSVHTGRMLLESLSRDCLLEMLPIIAILEKKSFLHKDGKWQEMKMDSKEHGDLFALSSLLSFLLRSDHTDGELSRLVSLGVSVEEIDLYKQNEIRTPLGLSVDLSPIGVKNQQLHAIAYLIEDLKRRLPSIDSRAHELLFHSEDISKASESEKKKQKQKQIYSQKVCITTGFLSHIFHSKKQQQKKKGPPKKEGETQKMRLIHQATLDEFIQGNSSVLEMDFSKKSSQEVFFVGQPFRIVPKGEDAISLALYLTPIDHDILEEATHHSSYDSAFAISTYDVSDEKSVVSYDLHKATYIEKLPKLKTRVQKKEYFAKHCLPSLIMEENPDIHEYVEGLTPVRQAIFEREVLPRIIARHTQAIHPENIEQTEQTFIHNPQIKEALQRSDDFFIKAFTSGQIDTFERAVMVKDEDTFYIPYDEKKEEFQRKSSKLKTISLRKELYKDEYLPVFLIQKNYHIQKYMETLSVEQKIIFRKYILPKLLINHTSRIYPNSLQKTEKSFLSDTSILDDLRESNDPLLIAFIAGKIDTVDSVLNIIDSGKKADDVEGIVEGDDGMSADLSRELYNAKLHYIRLASSAKRLFLDNGNEKFLDISEVKKKTVEKVYNSLLLPQAHLGLDKIQSYLSGLSETQRQVITVGIKEFQRAYENDLQKQQFAREKLLSLESIEGMFRTNTPGMIPQLTEYLGNLSDFISVTESADIISTYNLLRTGTQNKKKKGIASFEKKVVPIFQTVRQKIIHNNKPSSHSIHLDSIIDRLDNALYSIFSHQFDPTYFSHMVQPKLSELRNNIIRHSHTREDFYSELKKSFQKFSYIHMKGNQDITPLIEEYEGLLIYLEPYVDHYLSDGTSERDRLMNIHNISDLTMIEERTTNLEGLYKELKEKHTKIKDMLG